MSTKEKIKEEVEVSVEEGHLNEIVLFNDEVNTFDHVIDCLVAICDHDPIQAEQCAVLVHYKGSCEIAIGKEADLIPLQEDLSLYGLDVEIL